MRITGARKVVGIFSKLFHLPFLELFRNVCTPGVERERERHTVKHCYHKIRTVGNMVGECQQTHSLNTSENDDESSLLSSCMT